MPRAVVARRIEARVRSMRAAGLLDEVRGLAARGDLSRTARQAIGYKELLASLDGTIPSLDEAFDLVTRRTRAFAAAPAHVVPSRPAHHLAGRVRESLPPRSDPAGIVEAMSTVRLAKLHATGNDFLVLDGISFDSARASGARPGCAIGTGASVPMG